MSVSCLKFQNQYLQWSVRIEQFARHLQTLQDLTLPESVEITQFGSASADNLATFFRAEGPLKVLVWANGYLIAHIKLADIMAACLLNITVLRSQIWKPSRKWNIHTADLDRITPPQVLFVTLNTIKQSRQCWCHQWSAFTTLTCLHSKWKVTPTLLILWNVIMEAPPDLADFVHATLAFPFDFHFNRWYLLLMY